MAIGPFAIHGVGTSWVGRAPVANPASAPGLSAVNPFWPKAPPRSPRPSNPMALPVPPEWASASWSALGPACDPQVEPGSRAGKRCPDLPRGGLKCIGTSERHDRAKRDDMVGDGNWRTSISVFRTLPRMPLTTRTTNGLVQMAHPQIL